LTISSATVMPSSVLQLALLMRGDVCRSGRDTTEGVLGVTARSTL
jgi:hypothetical protein